MPLLCACGCGQEIEPKPHHAYQPPRYLPGHFQRSGALNRGKRWSGRRIPPGGTVCGCGCGTLVAEFFPSGSPRYSSNPDGKFFARGHHKAASGPASGHWKGGRMITSGGYVLIKVPHHRLAQADGYALEHRVVWEAANGRDLRPDEHVHHMNGDPSDNRPENLIALTNASHQRAHRKNPNRAATTAQLREAGRKGAERRWGKRGDH